MTEEASPRTVELARGDAGDLEVDVLAVPVRRGGGLDGPAAEVDRWSGGALARALGEERFRGKDDEELFLPLGEASRPHVLAVGVGEDPPGPEALRRAAGRAVREARRRRAGSLGFTVPGPHGSGAAEDRIEAAAQGLVLGDWAYDELRSPDREGERPAPPGRAVVHVPDAPSGAGDAVRRGRLVAEAQNWTRGLVARPANVATPSFLAARAEALAAEMGLEVQVWGPGKLREQGFGGLLAVSRGSREEPRFIILRHEGADEPPTVLVGKGVTFDSGGISLKPSKGMEDMKYDMAGGAAVLGTLRAVAALDLPRRVVGLVPATENLPSGTALKPGDVIRGVSGTSIEVVNTDAEGRLILSDALAWADRLSPGAVVDLATLTGACVVALGHHAMGLMTADDDLAAALEAAGERTGERTWRLPLWDDYRRQLDSEVADIKNSGSGGAGATLAGIFLREFVGDHPWAHLDIAGTAWAEETRGYQPEGATGVGVRLLVEWLGTGA